MKKRMWMVGLPLLAVLLARPGAAALGAREAMAQWQSTVAPALFPFLALMPLLTCREAAQAYERLFGGAMGALFNLPGAAASAMLIGLVAGAPAGVIAARSIAAGSDLRQGQLHRLAVACVGFSPAFLVGGVGVGMLGSAALGWRLVLSQLMTQLTLALILRRAWRRRTGRVAPGRETSGENPMRGAVAVALTICGYMAFFSALAWAVGALAGEGAGRALLCLLDVPSGARLVSAMPLSARARQLLLAAMCGFGGVCVIAQCLGALKGCGVRPGEWLGLRALAGALNAGYMALLTRAGAAPMPGVLERLRENPLAAAGLCAALLTMPALARLGKSIS